MRILLYTLMTLCHTVVLQQRCHYFEEEKEVGDFHYHARTTVLSAAALSSCNSHSSVPRSNNTRLWGQLVKRWYDNSKHTVQDRPVCAFAQLSRNSRNHRKPRVYQTVSSLLWLIYRQKSANQLADNIWKSASLLLLCLLCFVCSFGGYNTGVIRDIHLCC